MNQIEELEAELEIEEKRFNDLWNKYYNVTKRVEELTIERIDRQVTLCKVTQALAFYGDPSTYFAVGFVSDPPRGKIMEDFSNTKLGVKPGKLARDTIEGIEDTSVAAIVYWLSTKV